MTAGNSPLWEDDTWTPFAPLAGAAEADVCVVGLGGTGLTAVREALDRGLRVIGIDAGPVAGGAAGRNGGFLLAGLAAFHHNARRIVGADRARRLYECTIEQIDRMTSETPEAVHRVGSLRLATTPEEEVDCQVHFESLREDGLPAERYRGAEGVGLLIPSDAAFNPLLRCRLLARQLAARGARLHEGVPALHVGTGTVESPAGILRAGVILLASDGALAALAPAVADRVRPVRLQMLGTAPTEEVRIPRPVYARFGMEYWQQLKDGRITLGGFRDRGGEAEWTSDATPTEPVQSALERFLRDTLGVQAPISHRWAATVSYTRDGILPVLEEIEAGVWAMGGYNGTGNLVGPLCARAAVEMAVTGRSELGELLGKREVGSEKREGSLDHP
jgi:gamma-glutamylputrescine oxidase